MQNLTTWQAFEQLDIRAGTIVEVEDFPEAQKPAYQLKIDFGEMGILQSSAQVTELYSKETLLNKQVMAIVNFPPKQIANFTSECLVLGVYHQDGVVLLKPDQAVENGNKVG